MQYPSIPLDGQSPDLQIAIKILQSIPSQRQKTFPIIRSQNDINILIQCTKEMQFFKELSKNDEKQKAHRLCCRHLTYQFIPKSQVFIRQGNDGNEFWITLKGQVKVFRYRKRTDNWVSEFYHNENEFEFNSRVGIKKSLQDFEYQEEIITILGDGSSFGERGLLNQMNKRTANVETMMNSHFAVLHKGAFDHILNQMKTNERAESAYFFQRMNLMRHWNDELIYDLFDLTREVQYSYNQEVYAQNQKSDNVYFIKEGDFKLKVANTSLLQFKKRELLEQTKSLTKRMIRSMDSMKSDIKHTIHDENLHKRIERKRYIKSHTDLTLMGQGELFGDEDILFFTDDNESQRQRLFTAQCVSLVGKVYLIDINDFLVFLIKRKKLFPQWERAISRKVEHLQTLYASSKIQLNNNVSRVSVVNKFDYSEQKPQQLKISRSLRKLRPENEPGFINQIYMHDKTMQPQIPSRLIQSSSKNSITVAKPIYLKKKINKIPTSSEFIYLTAAKYNLNYHMDPRTKVNKTTTTPLNNSHEIFSNRQFINKLFLHKANDQLLNQRVLNLESLHQPIQQHGFNLPLTRVMSAKSIDQEQKSQTQKKIIRFVKGKSQQLDSLKRSTISQDDLKSNFMRIEIPPLTNSLVN